MQKTACQAFAITENEKHAKTKNKVCHTRVVHESNVAVAISMKR